MDEFFSRSLQDLMGRADGPMHLRLVLQSGVAAVLAIRAGLKDARIGDPPFLWSLASEPSRRAQLLRQAWKDIGKVFVAALVLDIVYQKIAIGTFYPGQAVIVAIVLAVLPYSLLRALVTRLFGKTSPP